MKSDLSKNLSLNPSRFAAVFLLALWLVVIMGFLTISFISVSCHAIDRQCTAEFIDGAQQSAQHAFQIEFTAFLFFFILIEIIQPVSLLQSVLHQSCCYGWILRDTTTPPPQAFA
jgi:hypothetical protein